MYPFARSISLLCVYLTLANSSFVFGLEPNAEAKPEPTAAQSDNAPPTVNINVSVDALSNRHPISSYVYGGAYPQDAPTITDSGLSVVRWGGNATSRYNWKLFTYNAANDWYFEISTTPRSATLTRRSSSRT